MNYFLKHEAAFKMFVDHFYQRGACLFAFFFSFFFSFPLTEKLCGRAFTELRRLRFGKPTEVGALPGLLGLELLGSGDMGS